MSNSAKRVWHHVFSSFLFPWSYLSSRNHTSPNDVATNLPVEMTFKLLVQGQNHSSHHRTQPRPSPPLFGGRFAVTDGSTCRQAMRVSDKTKNQRPQARNKLPKGRIHFDDQHQHTGDDKTVPDQEETIPPSLRFFFLQERRSITNGSPSAHLLVFTFDFTASSVSALRSHQRAQALSPSSSYQNQSFCFSDCLLYFLCRLY